MARVDRDFVGFGVALEHRDLPVRQLVLVLVDGGRGNDEQRLFLAERIGQETLAVHRTGIFRNTTGPRRNRAVSIAGLLGTERRERGAELAGFFRRYRGHHVDGQQTQGQCGTELQNHLAH
ncbi:hypothetical protein D3C87_1659310 [compost metagenome]